MISLDGNSPALAQENGFDVLYGAQAEHDAAELAWPVWALTALGLGGATALAVGGGGDSTPPSAGPDVTPPAAPAAITGYADDIGRITNPNSTAPVTDDNRPGFNVGTGLTDTPSLYVDGVKVPATYDPVTGTLTPTTPLGDGVHQFTTTLTDAAGNESPQSAALPLTVDTAAPAAPAAPTSTAPSTNDNTPGIHIGVGLTDTPSLYVDGVKVPATYDPVTGTLTPTTPLGDGVHQFTTTLTDAAGNESPQSAALPLTVDTAAPAAPAAPTSTAPSTNDNTPGIHIGVGLTDTPSLYVDGVKVPATYDPVTGMLTPTTPLGDGVHQFTTTLTDAAGNESPQSAALPLTVDTAAPAAPTGVTVTDDVAPVTGAIAANGASNDNKPTFAGAAGSAEAGSTITVMDGATVLGTAVVAADGSWSVTPTTALADGAHSITTRATDAAGNVSPVSPALALTVDTAAPAAPAAPTSTAPSTNDNTPGIHIGVGLTDTPSLYVDGVKVPATYDPVTGMLTPTTPLADGAHSITTTLTDAAGNESPQSAALPLTVDTAAPAAPTGVTVTDDVAPVTGAIAANGASNDNKPTFAGAAGSAEAGSTITVMDGATVLGTAVVAADGSWSVTPTTALADGAHSITTRATDAAGNVSPVSPALALTVDTAAPAAPAAPTSTAPSTNDNTPGIHIGVGLTDTPSLYVDGVKVPATYDPVTGMLTPTTPLADGAHSITTTLTDAAGNESPQSAALPLTVDTAAPAAPAAPTSTAPSTNDNTPGIHIGVGLTDTPSLYVDGVKVPATYDPVTGMLTPTTPLADGAHSITTTLTDAAGNESPQSAALPLAVDTAAPAAPTGVTVTDDVAPVTGAIAANGASNDNKPTFAGAAGSAEAGSTITVMDGATVLGTAVVAADGSWSVTPTTALADGAHSITTRATDAAGNVSPVSPALALTVDTAAPAAPAAPTSTAPSTNDNTPGIHIGVGLTDTPSLYVDGVKVPATYDPVTGMLTPTTPLADGAHSITTTLTDAAGNESPQSAALPLTVDTAAPAAPTGVTVTDDVAPVTGAIAANGASNDNKPTFAGAAGSAEAGSTITVMDGATVLGTAVVAADGSWSVTPTTALADGAHSITTRATDAAGNVSPVSPALALTVDTAAPAAPAAPTSTAPSTNDNTPGIHIGVGLTDTPSLYVDGVKVPATYDPVTGMLTPTTPLADGAHSITTTLTDAAGNESPQSAALPLTVDTAAPAAPTGVTVTDDVAPVTGAIAANGASNDNKPTFAGAAGSAEAGSTITVMDGATVLGTAVVAADGSWSVTPTTALADGAHSITTRATDAAGNVSPVSPALALTVDTAAPAAPAAPTSTAPSTNDNTPGIHIGVGLTDTPSLYVDGVKVPATYDPVTGMLTPTTPLADGAHSITTTLTDAAGNESPQSAALPLTVDTAAPAAPTGVTVTDDVAPVAGAIAANGASNDNKPTFAGAAGSAEAGSTITVMDGATVLGTAVVAADGSWSVTPTTALADGAHSITTRATDAAGNVSPVSPALALTVDTAAPAAPAAPTSTAPSTNDNTPGIHIGVGLTDTPSLYVDGVKVPATYDPVTGMLTPTTPLGDGVHQFTTTLTDAAGNESPQSAALPLTVDTAAPAAPTGVTVTDDVAPVTGAIAANGASNDNKPTFAGAAGSAEAGSTITVMDGATVLGTAVVAADGSWSVTPTTALADGAHSITTRATDAAGNVSPVSPALALTVDTAAPAAPAAPTSTAPSTNDNTPGIHIGVGLTDTPSLYVDGVKVPATYDPVTGMLTPTTPLADGAHSITTTLTDAAGNESPQSAALPLTVDTAAPAAPTGVTVTDDVAPVTGAIAANGASNDNKPTFAGAAGSAEAGSTITVMDGATVLGTAVVAADGSWSVTPTTALADGAHSITTRATDAAGNVSPVSPALALTVDTAAPAAPAAPTSTAPSTNDNTPGIHIGVGLTDTPSLYVDGVKVPATYDPVTGMLTPTTPLADGAHSITTTLTDAAGNVSPVSPALALTVDTAAPAAPTAPTSTAPSTNDNTPGIHIGVGLTDTPSLYVDGVKVPATYDPVTGMLTPTTPLADGAHSITTTLTDAAGNESPQSAALPLTVDTAAPAAPTGVTVTDDVAPVTGAIAANGASNDNKPTFAGAAGSAEAGSTITVMDGATVLGTAVVAADGSWSVTPTTALADGAHSITTRATDAAGNVSPVSPALALTVDTAAPAAPAAPTSTAPSTNDNTPGIHIGVGLTDTPSLYVDGVKVPATYDPVTGMLTPTTPLADGAHSITTTLTDAAGNESPQSAALPLTVDTAAPAAPTGVTVTDDVAPVTGAIAANGASNDNKPTFAGAAGSAEAGSTITVMDGATVLGTAVVAADGSWSVTPTTALADGAHSITTRATDAAGNVSPVSPALALTVDTVAPTTTASVTAIRDDVGAIKGTVASGGVTDDTSLVVSGTLSTGLITGERVRIYDGSSYLGDATVSGTSWTYADSRTLTDGQSVSYTARVSDPAGNQSAAGTAYTATVDTLDTFTWGGETHALNLVARVNAQDGKTYYALDANGNGAHDSSDRVTHNWLDGLLNGGADTVDTQPGGAVKGVDDARTVIINGNTWVLPTLAELNALYNDSTVANPPAGWGGNYFWSSTRSGLNYHNIEYVDNGSQYSTYDTLYGYVAFQVL
ncbi:Ig-like domain-containing protein [Aeromonas caviae]|nr:Ig-like domain-containing protein [Aeromonas caviae]